jgi:hypothetical protein
LATATTPAPTAAPTAQKQKISPNIYVENCFGFFKTTLCKKNPFGKIAKLKVKPLLDLGF